MTLFRGSECHSKPTRATDNEQDYKAKEEAEAILLFKMAPGVSQEQVPDIAFPKRSKRNRLEFGFSRANDGPGPICLLTGAYRAPRPVSSLNGH